ncbi:PEP-CTERM sorting domain-containing protein [Roseateles sp. LYH14W]|uniref:PEP-CTERM sorting domain-containing protein n=1 Tax=Pelomonas parva TaxID=3299032 RepID=A0ABW7FDV0_9BURK
MKFKHMALSLGLVLTSPFAAASLIYTFSYDAVGNYAAASINFSSAGFAQNTGDVLTYVSGDINGCSPTSIAVDSLNAFATPVFGLGSCGDGTGVDVDGLFFRPDVMPPMSLGTFFSTQTAGRQFESGGGSNFYVYSSGLLTIRDAGDVPEPTSWALAGLALALAAGTRAQRRTK